MEKKDKNIQEHVPKKEVEPKKETVQEKKPKKALDKAIDTKIAEIIQTGILLKENAFENLHKQICKEFPDKKPGRRLFNERVKKIIWVKIDKSVQEAVRAKLDSLEGVERIFPYIPKEMISERAKWHRGLISGRGRKLMGKALPGIGRIDLSGAISNFKMPKAGFNEPVKIKTADPNNWSIMFLNGSDLGVKYTPDIVGNVTRRALSDADERKDDAVILTNMICMDLKKAGGPAKAMRAQIYGDNVNPELIQDPEYKKTVEHILAEFPPDEVIYGTPEELVNDLLSGWIKIGTKPAKVTKSGKEEPEYKGPVYIVFGLNEKALATAVAYWEINWWTRQEQKKIGGEIKLTKRAIKDAEKELGTAVEGNDAEEIKKLYELIQEHNKNLEALEYRKAVTTITSTRNQEWQRFFNNALSVLVQKFESAIPNAKVIGQNTSYIEVNGGKYEINIPASSIVSEGLLNSYTSCYAPDVLREKIVKAAVICHPWAVQYRATGREVDHDGNRDSMKVYVAPIAVDGEFLRSQLDSGFANTHPLLKAVYSPTFQPGVLRLCSTNGTIDADAISVKALESFEKYPVKKNGKNGSSLYSRGPEYIWIFNCSDQHWGGRAREYMTDKGSGMRVGVAEAVFLMMRKAGLCEGNNMRVHIFASPDDPTQGYLKFNARTQPHPHQMPFHIIERLALDLLNQAKSSKNKEEAISHAEKMLRLLIHQLEKRGSDYLLEQMMQMMSRHLEANADAFSAILKRAQSAKLVINGVGHYVNSEFGGFDTRNIGAINIGSGNHFTHTLEGELAEGPLYAQKLRDLLLATSDWKNSRNLLEKLIVSPFYSGECIGYGVIGVKGKHEYGFELRASPTNMQGWGDPLRGHVRKDLQRGNYSRIFNNRLPVIKIMGDKHFFSSVITSYTIYHLCPSATHTDRYGDKGFPPNNTGVSFVGVPVDGPDSGPILIRSLLFDKIKDYIEDNPRPFNWERFLPNPA